MGKKPVYCPECKHHHDTFASGFTANWVCTRKAIWRRDYQTGKWEWFGYKSLNPNRKGKCRYYKPKEDKRDKEA